MYIPAHFEERQRARVRALVADHSFGMLLVLRPGGPPAIAHLPFLLDDEPGPHGTLRAHVARANPIAPLLLAADLPVVAVFTGPHGYVTPRWYASPATHVPTWNFTAVHLHGVARAERDPAEARRTLADLTAKHEAGAPEPWSLGGADADYVEKLLRGIVAFSIRVERVEAKFKLSQNRSPEDQAGVVRGLRARRGPDDEALVALMEENERGSSD